MPRRPESPQSPDTPRGLNDWIEGKTYRRPLDELPDELLAQVRAGYRSGIGVVLITRWLRDEMGIDWATESRVVRYLQREGVERGEG